MKQNKFDIVMDYIDENIKCDTEEIKRGIIDQIGINSNRFGEFFNTLTGDTLGSYIRSRRLYYAAKELQGDNRKPICDIALDFGYSDQSSFTRAFTTKYGFSPNELRQKDVYYFLENNKYLYEDFDSHTADSRSDRIWREFERTGLLSGADPEFVENVESGRKKFGFDIDTCYAIADLAERLEVPAYDLMETCFDLVAEIKSDPHYIPHRELAAMSLGIPSDEELQKVCEHYACKYYELNEFMVERYYETQS